MTETTEDSSGTLPQIVDAAVAIITAESPGQPMLMSKLGLRLAARFGSDLRDTLGARKLRDVLTSALGDAVSFEGSASNLAVRLREGGTRSQRFDPVAWAAFAKPISLNKVRYFKPSRPLDFKDFDDADLAPSGWVAVSRDLIPAVDMPKPERDTAITKSLYTFADSIGVPVSDFLFLPKSGKHTSPSTVDTASPKGAAALIQLIEAIPVSERSSFHLPLDLVHRLLKL